MKKVDIFCDGACSGNPGPGGFGAVLKYGEHRRELSGGFAATTNNRMELFGAIAALEALRESCEVALSSDSSYLVNAVSKHWLENWKARAWRKSDRKEVLNRDLWMRLDAAMARHKVKFVWVKGHADNAENNRCDELARTALAGENLPADEGFDGTVTNTSGSAS